MYSTAYYLQKRKCVWTIAFALCALLVLSITKNSQDWFQASDSHIRHAYFNSLELTAPRRHIAVASHFPQHFDVHLAAVKTIRDVLGQTGHVQVFAYTPFLHGFQDIVDELALYDDEIKHPDEFMTAVQSTRMYEDEPGVMVDLVMFGTCEIDMPRWSTELLAAWDARPADQKFKLVCIVHHFADTQWQEHITPWAARGAIRLLPIANHVGEAFRLHFKELADSTDPDFYNAMYEYINIDVHVPVLDLPHAERRTTDSLSRAVIQGNFASNRRDYPHIFLDLLMELQKNPGSWGYLPLSNDSDVYEPLPDLQTEPFTLHLVGEGFLEIPKALSNIIITHNGLSFLDFYALIQSMDIVVPAFVNRDYYDFQASSTVAMAVQCNVPILVSQRMRKSYRYIDDDRVTVTRPQALREIPAIGVLRQGHFVTAADAPHTNTDVYINEFLADVAVMLHQGWRRTRAQFDTFKRGVWLRNREAIARVLQDQMGEI